MYATEGGKKSKEVLDGVYPPPLRKFGKPKQYAKQQPVEVHQPAFQPNKDTNVIPDTTGTQKKNQEDKQKSTNTGAQQDKAQPAK